MGTSVHFEELYFYPIENITEKDSCINHGFVVQRNYNKESPL